MGRHVTVDFDVLSTKEREMVQISNVHFCCSCSMHWSFNSINSVYGTRRIISHLCYRIPKPKKDLIDSCERNLLSPNNLPSKNPDIWTQNIYFKHISRVSFHHCYSAKLPFYYRKSSLWKRRTIAHMHACIRTQ